MSPKDTETKKIVVYTLDPWDHALTHLRFRAPAEQLGWHLLQGREGNSVDLDSIREADIVLVQRMMPHWYEVYRQIVEAARFYQKPLIYEIDDLLIAIPPSHPYVEWYRPGLEYILLAIIEADRVVVSSNLLADIFCEFNPDIKVWPAYLPDLMWRPKEQLYSPANVVRIGYMGGSTHTPDLDIIAPVLQKILNEWGDQVELNLWGCKPSEVLNGNVVIHYLEEKINYGDFADYFSQVQADIWLAPLQDSIFNRCKSSIKYWEYAAVGGVGVFSDLEPYQRVVSDQEDGFLANNNEDWYNILANLIRNPSLRQSVTLKARNKLEEYGWMSFHLDEWRQIYTNIKTHKDPIKNCSPQRQTFYRFAQQLHERSTETEQIIQSLNEELQRKQNYLEQLEQRSQHLDAILNSRSWRLIQWMGKLRR